jgi:LysM repeat protein/Ca2+-binding RTX toxin-like protein
MAAQAERESVRQRAQDALKAGDYRSAHSLLRYLIRQDPKDMEARKMLAGLQSQQVSSSAPPRKAQPAATQRGPLWRFRSLSMVGALALLLLLVIALMMPEGAILASKDSAAAPLSSVVNLRLEEVSLDGGQEVTPTGTVTAPMIIIEETETTGAVQETETSDGTETMITVVTTSTVATGPVIPGQGGVCISGFIIDRYHKASGAGWTVTLTSEDGETVTLEADAHGQFDFEDLAGGTYMVTLDVPDGWRAFTPASFPVTLSGEGTDCAAVRFKVEALPCLIVSKLDAGGQAGLPGKAGIPGWEMTATQGDIRLTAVTDGQGRCYFYDLLPGTWTVTEESKVGWRPASNYGYEQSIALTSPTKPGQCESLKFVNEQVHEGCIQVQKVDAVGVPLKDWKITLVRDDGTQPSLTTYTDSAGYAVFDKLAMGQWTVTEAENNWWRALGATEQAVNVTVPGHCETVVFANEPLGCVDGYKINHLEQGLPRWTVTAFNEATGEVFTTTTDSDGYFMFKGLTLGAWTISEDIPEGWEPVTPPEFVVEVKEPFTCEPVRFKNRTNYACVDVFKTDYTDGSGLPGWEISIEPAYGGEAVTGQTDGTGWVRFNGLVPGSYIISEESQAGWLPVSDESVNVTLEASGSCEVIEFVNIQETAPPPKKVKPKPAPKPKPPQTGCTKKYTVKKCDTLYSIARRHGTTVKRLTKINGLANPNVIYVGQVLCIK